MAKVSQESITDTADSVPQNQETTENIPAEAPATKPAFVRKPVQTSSAPKFSFKPGAATTAPGADYESVTLMRLRKIERERLEHEIREREEKEAMDEGIAA